MGRAGWQRHLWHQHSWSWGKGVPRKAQVTNDLVFPHPQPIHCRKLSPWITGSLLLQVSENQRAENPAVGRNEWHALASLLLQWITERRAGFVNGWEMMDLQVCGGWERVIGQVPCKGISCPEEVALSKAHSGMKEGDSGKALLQVFFYFCVGAKTVFPLTRQARRTLFWLLGTAASAAINAMAYANT